MNELAKQCISDRIRNLQFLVGLEQDSLNEAEGRVKGCRERIAGHKGDIKALEEALNG